MKYAITGGAGFLGYNLCQTLLKQGHEILCIDDLSSGQSDHLKKLERYPQCRIIVHDVTNPIAFHADAIFHLACPASPVIYQKDPVRTARTNFIGTLNMLELSRKEDIPMLLTSTSEVYGEPDEHPQRESYWGHVNPVGVRSCYDEGKRIAETLMMDYSRMYGVKSKIVRIFNTYGPYMSPDDGRVVSNFIVQSLSGRDITISGDGTQTRSFCYVEDLVDGLIRMMRNPAVSGPVNLGNPNEITIMELAELILELTGSTSRIQHIPLPSDDPTHRKPDITLAEQLLDWQPSTQLADGLAATIRRNRNPPPGFLSSIAGFSAECPEIYVQGSLAELAGV